MRAVGFENTDPMVTIDVTQSNCQQLNGGSLHDVTPADGPVERANPYEQVLFAVGRVLINVLDRARVVPCYGFGAEGRGLAPTQPFALAALTEAPQLYGWLLRHGMFSPSVAPRSPISPAPSAPAFASGGAGGGDARTAGSKEMGGNDPA